MSWDTPETQYLDERTQAIIDIPLTDQDGTALAVASVDALTASLYAEDAGAIIFSARNVLSSLGAVTVGTLALTLTADDLTLLTTRDVERLTLTISIRYATTAEAHLAIPCRLRRVRSAADLTP